MRNVSRASALLVCFLLVCHPAGAYSLLTHEQLIDLTWQSSIAPLLRSRYPNITPEQLERARSYAYAGCVIQDIGYYPFGDPFFSDLTHYVRSGDFVVHLFRDAKDANQLAFAIGALSHYIGDNMATPRPPTGPSPWNFPSWQRNMAPSSPSAKENIRTSRRSSPSTLTILRSPLCTRHYLRHVGLNVPTEQLATAFYETYGLSEDFSKARSRRINVGGFRFAVRSFVPRIAYALTLLHRSRMPADSTSPDLQKLADEVARVAAENNWDHYRKKAGIGTYSLAGFIYVLPKIGPLKLLAIKGPTDTTEEQYVRSVNQSTDALSAALGRFGKPGQTLPNRDLDTGARSDPGLIASQMTPMPSSLTGWLPIPTIPFRPASNPIL